MIKNVEAVDALLPEVEKKTFGFLMNLTVELHYSLSFMMWAHLESSLSENYPLLGMTRDKSF